MPPTALPAENKINQTIPGRLNRHLVEDNMTSALYGSPAPYRLGYPTHSVTVGYLGWIFGFMGIHRFYFGRPITGIVWALTGGVFLIGWIIDLFLIPGMQREAAQRYVSGPIDYSVVWILHVLLGVFGVHRFYMGKWITGILFFFSGGLFLLGWLYDLLTLNDQVSELNRLGAS